MKKDFNMNGKLDELIMQYKIDRFHPRFSVNWTARQAMLEFFENYSDKNIIMITSCQTDYQYIQEDCGLRNKCSVVYYSQLEEYSWHELGEDSIAIIVSFYGRREVKSSLYEKGVASISVYDYLAERGIIQTGNYYDIFGEEYHTHQHGDVTFDYANLDMNAVFFYDRRNYEIAQSKAVQEMYLAKMIFDCVYIKDWELTEKYIDEYIECGFSFVEEYKQFKREMQNLLDEIKSELQKRNKDDIVIFWLDALEPEEDKDMPFLHSIGERSLNFLNAYTVTPYTHSTAKAMFAHKYVVDDRSYKLDINSKLEFISNMETQGYDFLYYTHLNHIDSALKGRIYQNFYTTLTEECWNMISDMLKSDRKICAVLHEISHTHSPFISYGLKGNSYFYISETINMLNPHTKTVKKEQMLESRKYVDKVLKRYSDMLPENVYKIFMSDHGHTLLNKYHTIFRVMQKDIAPQKVEKMFSYINFDRLIYKLLKHEKDYSDIIGDYVQIQDVDYYNKELIKFSLNNGIRSSYLQGYKGIISLRHCYIRYNDGRERYFNNDYSGEPLTDDKVDYLRKLCAEYPQDIIQDEQFKYYRNIYATLSNYMKRNGEWEAKKMLEITKLFDTLPDESRVAIRGGGIHTLELWVALKQKQQEKIVCVIDTDERCVAARLGIKVISADDIKREKIDMILVSSFQYESAWVAELKENIKHIPIVGLYDYLKMQGVECTTEFYKKEYTEADIVWEE